jgi:hypothetical protein
VINSNITRRGIAGGFAAGIGLAAAAKTEHTVIRTARAQSNPKTFLLIHGAWVGGWYWRRVADLLQQKGHKVFSPTLTGLGERSHLLSRDISLETHAMDIVNVIKWEGLTDICYVAHSYAGFPASSALDQIAERVSSIVWLDAFKPNDGEKLVDFLNDARRQPILSAFEKGELGLKGPKAEFFLVNENDRALVDSKATPHPTRTFVEPIKLSGAREKVTKKTYIRANRYPSPGFDKALADCKADKSWVVVETSIPGHVIMLDAPEWLTDQLLQAA